MVVRVFVVLGGALLAVNAFGASAHAIFVLIAAANVVSCVVLALLFRRTLAALATA
jgi:hypothetical protein